jgi:predicted  nucleic acid-binding Zn-ribbon protein
MSGGDFEFRHAELEKDIATARGLLAELRQKMEAATSDFEKRRLEVNIEDVTTQLKDFEYALSEMTHGKE